MKEPTDEEKEILSRPVGDIYSIECGHGLLTISFEDGACLEIETDIEPDTVH